MKALIDKVLEKTSAIENLCELPAEMTSVSITYLTAITMTTEDRKEEGLVYSLIGLILIIVVLFLRNRSLKSIDSSKKYRWLTWFIPSFLIALFCITMSISLLNGYAPFNKKKGVEIQTQEEMQ